LDAPLHQFAVHLAAAHLAHLKHHQSSLAASEVPTFRLAVSMAIGQRIEMPLAGQIAVDPCR
jgi:hypothetical protein